MQMMFFDPPVETGFGEIASASKHDGKPVVFIGWKVAEKVHESGMWRLTLGIDAANALIERIQAAINGYEQSLLKNDNDQLRGFR